MRPTAMRTGVGGVSVVEASVPARRDSAGGPAEASNEVKAVFGDGQSSGRTLQVNTKTLNV